MPADRSDNVAPVASRSLKEWQNDASAAFDEIENAHRAVGGTKPGRRFLTQQVNYAYVTLLAARFQGFARSLHTQTAAVIATGAHNGVLASSLDKVAADQCEALGLPRPW